MNYPLSKKEQKKRIDHDPRLAKKILTIIGAAVLAWDAYDRRERPGKKRRGPESPAEWRRVPRRRHNLESA